MKNAMSCLVFNFPNDVNPCKHELMNYDVLAESCTRVWEEDNTENCNLKLVLFSEKQRICFACSAHLFIDPLAPAVD